MCQNLSILSGLALSSLPLLSHEICSGGIEVIFERILNVLTFHYVQEGVCTNFLQMWQDVLFTK